MTENICKTKEDIDRFLACDPAHIPVIEANLRNVLLPLCADDHNFFQGFDAATGAQIGVDYFANPQGGGQAFNPRAMSRGAGLVRSGLKFRTDFILDAICIQVHCEPNAWALDGNQFTTQALVLANGVPASPVHPWEAGAASIPWYGPGTAIALNRVNSQLEWGGPTWRAAHWFLQSFRLKMQCPSAANINELLNERVVDLGNCCLGTSYAGYGESEASPVKEVKFINGRLRALQTNNQLPVIPATRFSQGNGILAAGQEVGFFVPFNCEDTMTFVNGINGTVGTVKRTPERTYVKKEAYGSQDVSPGASSKWYRLPIPRVIQHDENIEIILQTDPNDIDFLDRMFLEMSVIQAAGAAGLNDIIPGLTGSTGGGATGTTAVMGDGTYTCLATKGYVRIPGGYMRVGIALKGWMLDANLCSSIRGYYNNLSYTEAMKDPALMARAAGGQFVDMVDLGTRIPNATAPGSCGCGGR
jgi:hypothetical protein